MTEPLLKNRESYEPEERDVFVTTPETTTPEKPDLTRNINYRRRFIFFLGLSAVIILAAAYYAKPPSSFSKKPHRNVIILISDGFGPASVTYSRTFYQTVNNLTFDHQTPLDTILVGTSRTRSSNSLVTDSAAGATAFSCGVKTYNAAIGVTPAKLPCGTVLEAAKLDYGMATGLVVTSRITHATPACFSTHGVHRDMESTIANQQIGDYPLGRTLDLVFGGGRCFFLPNHTEGSCRDDDRDLWNEASTYGWKNMISSVAEFNAIEEDRGALPLMGLFSKDHLSYEIDRNRDKEPSLNEMAAKALSILSKATENQDKGFFLMIEGSRIDMAAHSNDAGAHVHDILAYQDTIATVKEFVDANPGTVMISVSDHETGGFTLGRQPSPYSYPKYLWYPEVIARIRNSTTALQKAIRDYNGLDKETFVREEIVKKGLGIDDATDEEITDILAGQSGVVGGLDGYLSNMTSYRAQLGWTTHGHTGLDVNLYAYGEDFEKLQGNHENTDIGNFIAEFLNLDLAKVTEQLNLNSTFTTIDSHKLVEVTDGLEHYHSHPPSRFLL